MGADGSLGLIMLPAPIQRDSPTCQIVSPFNPSQQPLAVPFATPASCQAPA